MDTKSDTVQWKIVLGGKASRPAKREIGDVKPYIWDSFR